jgi:hypothetical protein
MALARYSEQYWFRTSQLAAGERAYVFPRDSSAPASLFADAAGTVPLANPTATDGSGFLTFYATAGDYWISIDDLSFMISVGMTEEQADLSTGIASGGELDIVGAQSITIHSLIGYIVSNLLTSATSPIITRVDFPGVTITLDAGSLTRPITWLLMDSNQVIIQQATRPTPVQRRTHLILGGIVFDVASLTLLEAQTLPVWLPQQANQVADLMDSLGPFSISGNVISPNGANLMINKTSGSLFARAFNLFVSGVLTGNPHVTDIAAQTPAVFRRILRAVPTVPPTVNTIDPANYDLNNVLTPVGGGANSSTIQRVWLFAVNDVSLRIAVQYGQSTYNSLAAATAAIGAGTFVPSAATVDAALIGYIAVIRTATDLSNPAQATFVTAGKFATP